MSSNRSVALLIVSSLACSLGATPATAQMVCDNATASCTKQLTVRPGGSVVLMPGASSINPDCSFRPLNLNVQVRPKQGRVVPRLIAKTIEASGAFNTSSPSNCVGRPTKGLQVTYYANRNASGSDEVVVRITGPGPGRAGMFRFRIAIQ